MTSVAGIENTAFDEAAHAWCREYFNDNVVEIAIGEDSGHCDFRRRMDGDKDITLLGNVASCVAGKVAVDSRLLHLYSSGCCLKCSVAQ
jgi:hypothetical protein